MNYKVKTIPTFDKQAKRLAKKYKSLKYELGNLIDELLNNPECGVGIGQNCYKIRLSIKSKGRGKSGGGRVVTHVHIVDEVIFLLLIYDKSEKENLNENELDELLEEIDY
jgi:mRNA-degrading endonuclease RelE of RelBE toxin-antitoxin system